MAENPRYARRGRTHFSVEQLQALKRVFEKTMYPDWATTEELISITHLDDPYDIDQFIQLYALPGDDDPSSLDQYLPPKCRS
ncbi:leucine-twenty homeobox [Eumetopias jubatus]|uniref:leucine-twenty homeobox n=1 Tax=Eumetopias jubatus TaxID=34886 RepID=UPI0010160881|nr:leucine-twenty homeobox [Eumetopias jubatus]